MKLTDCRVTLSQDGQFARFDTEFDGKARLRITHTFADVASSLHRLKSVIGEMAQLQRCHLDWGRSTLEGMRERAIEAVHFATTSDPLTGEIYFTLQFTDHMPLVIRMDRVHAGQAVDETMKTLARTRQ